MSAEIIKLPRRSRRAKLEEEKRELAKLIENVPPHRRDDLWECIRAIAQCLATLDRERGGGPPAA